MILDWRQFCDVHTYFDNSFEWAHGGAAAAAAGDTDACFMLLLQ